jgi:hypothetical protein
VARGRAARGGNECVHADGSCPHRRIFTSADGKSRPRVKSRPRGKRGCPDKKDVLIVNFIVGRPFRHPWS